MAGESVLTDESGSLFVAVLLGAVDSPFNVDEVEAIGTVVDNVDEVAVFVEFIRDKYPFLKRTS